MKKELNRFYGHNGSTIPVHQEDIVDVYFRGGKASFHIKAGSVVWRHTSSPLTTDYDIVAYVVRQQHREKVVMYAGYDKNTLVVIHSDVAYVEEFISSCHYSGPILKLVEADNG